MTELPPNKPKHTDTSFFLEDDPNAPVEIIMKRPRRGHRTITFRYFVTMLIGAIVTFIMVFLAVYLFTGSNDNKTVAKPIVTPTVIATSVSTVTITDTPTVTTTVTFTPTPVKAFGPGFWVVGTDIKAGTYRTSEDVPEGSNCYFEQAVKPAGEIIVSNSVVAGRPTVVLRNGNTFDSHECGDWTRVRK